MVTKEIKKLFLLRDKAVKEKNKKLFLSTQVGEIASSSSQGYLSIDKLETKILTVDFPDKDSLTSVAVINETYFIKGKKPHSGILLYHLVNTVRGWKIYKIVY